MSESLLRVTGADKHLTIQYLRICRYRRSRLVDVTAWENERRVGGGLDRRRR